MESSSNINVYTPYIIFIINLLLAGTAGFVTAWVKLVKYQQKVDHLENDNKALNSAINQFRTDIATLNEFKIQAQKFIDKTIYKSASPLSLTELGEKLVNESGFLKIFENEKNNLCKMLEKKDNPITKYDVQEKSRELMDNLRDYPAFAPIKLYAYNSGKDFGQILRAGAIPLRDYYLSIHPEINN